MSSVGELLLAMETVQAWLRSLNLEVHAEAIFNHGVTSMLRVRLALL